MRVVWNGLEFQKHALTLQFLGAGAGALHSQFSGGGLHFMCDVVLLLTTSAGTGANAAANGQVLTQNQFNMTGGFAGFYHFFKEMGIA